MTFLEIIRPFLCHESVVPGPGPCVACQECGSVPIPNVNEFIVHASGKNIYRQVEYAQMYAEWSGDYEIHVPLVVMGVEGILDKKVEGQSLRRLYNGLKLLQALNAPFTHGSVEKPTLEMQNFLSEYMSVIQEVNQREASSTEQTTLKHILESLNAMINSEDFSGNKFDFYFDKLVPYVQACTTKPWTPEQQDPHNNVAKQVLQELKQSSKIRKRFGRYSIPFDIFHVLVACYVCCTDIDIVANWALDLVIRICRGEFFWKAYDDCQFVQHYRSLITKYFVIKRRNKSETNKSETNMDLYYLVRDLAKGTAIESLSENFVKYCQLDRFFREKLKVSSADAEMVHSQLFPAVLFENQIDQIAFTIAFGHAVNQVDKKTGQPSKGTFSSARKLHDTLKTLMVKAHEFDSRGEHPPWVLETLRAFLLFCPSIDKLIANLVSAVMPQENEE